MKTSNATCRPDRSCSLLLLAALLAASGCQFAATGQNIEGVRLFDQGNHAGALQRFQQAVASDPKNADAYYNMGRTFHELGKQSGSKEQLATAETLYNQCLDADGDHVDCHRALAVLLAETDRADRAFALVKTGRCAISRTPMRGSNWPGSTTNSATRTRPDCTWTTRFNST